MDKRVVPICERLREAILREIRSLPKEEAIFVLEEMAEYCNDQADALGDD